MDLIFVSILIATVCLFVKFIQNGLYSRQLPPGPWGFPIVGHIPLLGGQPQITFKTWRQIYGDIYRIRLGSSKTVIVNGRDAIKEVLGGVTADLVSDRPASFTTQLLGGDRGLTFSYYTPRYVHLRRVANSVLKVFTDNRKTTIHEVVENEANMTVKEFLDHKEEPFDPYESILAAIGSIVYRICYGRADNGREDPDFVKLLRGNKDFSEFVGAGSPFDTMPFLRFIFPKKFKKFIQLSMSARMLGEKKISEHKETFDDDDIRDITDGLISASNRLNEEGKYRTGLQEHMINESVEDLVGAGIDTTFTTLNWAFMYMAKYPDVQTKVRNEIDTVVGIRSVMFQDRPKLTYTEATLLETLRIAAIAPFGVPHATTCDIKIRDFLIPKGTALLLNLYSANLDENIWEHPSKFDPERFLTDDGVLDQKKIANILSFGIGKRRCIGETFARMVMFLFFANVLQKCIFEKPLGETYEKEGIFQLMHKPKPYKVRVRERRDKETL